MTAKPGKITDTELSVMKVLWDQSPVTARDVAQKLYGRASETEIGTVHTLLVRLEKKGFVLRDRSSMPHQFAAALTQVQLAGQQLEQMADKLSDGSLSPFITHLFDANKLGKEELDTIRELLDRFAQGDQS